MCGIAGWFSQAPIPSQAQTHLNAMVAAIRHRGPDGQGTVLHEHAALGHARLAIIDVSGGAQPMSTRDGALSITFNGEIYNFIEIRNYLKKLGVQFQTHSDTEVILHLYQQEGWQGFSRLRGMYAFAIWDKHKNLGLLVRDPLGIKPLFITKTDSDLSFSSEAKSILARGKQAAELDEGALHLLMNFRYLPGDRSLFRGIKQLQPGAVLLWQRNGAIKEFFIEPQLHMEDTDVLQVLRTSVQSHLTSDVEVGAYLSGGTDSATIVALADGFASSRLRTFTLAIGDDPNEAKNATRSAELLGADNITGTAADDLKHSLPRLIWHLEVPKINALQVNQVASLAAKHVKVVLSGLGGDELFLGYNAHRILYLTKMARNLLPRIASSNIGHFGASLINHFSNHLWTESERGLLMMRELGNWFKVYGLLRNVWDSDRLRAEIYGPRMLDAKLPQAFTVLEEAWPNNSDPVMAMAEFEWKQKMVNDLLWQEDRMSMAEGLEVRVPFVDLHLSARIRQIERKILMPGGRPKGYMRNLLSKVLPEEILMRPKSGFQVDSPTFFAEKLASIADEILSDTRIRDIGLFNPGFVKKIRNCKLNKNMRWHYFILYLMLTTHLWIDLFEKQSWKQDKL